MSFLETPTVCTRRHVLRMSITGKTANNLMPVVKRMDK